MTDLAAFLLARIEEAERMIRSDGEGWLAHAEGCDFPGDYPGVCTCGSDDHARAECEAKRRLIELHGTDDLEQTPQDVEDYGHLRFCRVCEDRYQHQAEHYPCLTLRLLALPYASHADYDETWAPA